MAKINNLAKNMTSINDATSLWWKSFGTSYKEGSFKEFYYEFLNEVVRVLHVNNYTISNKHLAEFIEPRFHEETILQFLSKTESKILSAFIKYDETYREKIITGILPALLNKKSSDIKDYLIESN